MRKIIDGYEGKMVEMVTNSGSMILGVLIFKKTNNGETILFFESAIIGVYCGDSRECKSVSVYEEDIEIIALQYWNEVRGVAQATPFLLLFFKISFYSRIESMSYNTQNFKIELKKVEEWLSKEYSQVHTGRATPIVLDSIMVQSYGSYMPIKNVAGITIEDPKTLRVAPWDKNQIKDIEIAISASNLGLSVVSDSDGVRVIFPMLTTENRMKLVKVLKEKLEDARISVRKERQGEMDKLDAITDEDDAKRAKEDIQKAVDEINLNLEAVFNKKETEIMN